MDIIISNSSNVPLYEQVKEQIKNKIVSNELKAGELLPSIRSLAKDLRISVITTKSAYDELERDIERFIHAAKNIEVGKISGAVGTFANVPAEVQDRVCELLGLTSAKISTQVLQRDRHIEYCNTLALIASSLEKIALEIRNLQRTEVSEVNEYFSQGQKGSSAMPHKKNPISSENVTGLARYVVSSLTMAIMNNDLWHERDISHSSNERIYISDDISLIIYILRRTNNILSNLDVHEDKMIEDINSDYGVIYSGRVMNYILSHETKSYSREEIYDAIQVLAFKAYNEHIELKDLLLQDKLFSSLLSKEELDELFSYSYVFKNVDKIYQAVGILD